MRLLPAAMCLALVPLVSNAALADDIGWRRDGTPVAVASNIQSAPQVISDGAGGAYISWQDYRSGGSRIYVQRLTPAGTVFPGWLPDGVPTIEGADHTVALDPRGGVLVGVTRLYGGPNIGRVTPDGAFITTPGAPSVPADDFPAAVRSRPQQPASALKAPNHIAPTLQGTPDGGMILAWSEVGLSAENVFVLRYGADMQLAPGWPGPAHADSNWWTRALAPVVCSGVSGDVYVAWAGRNRVAASRLTSRGALAPGWPLLLEQVPETSDDVGVGIVPDGQGGAIVIWQRPDEGVRAQRLLASGARAPGWAEPWVALSRFPGEPAITRYPGSQWVRYARLCAVATDGEGGAYVAWSDRRRDEGDIYVQRVRSNGAIAEGWPADGLAVCAEPGPQRAPSLAGDGAGGVFVAWQDTRLGGEADLFAARVTPAGSIAPGWSASGQRLCGQGAEQQIPRLAADGAGRAIVAWQDGRCGDLDVFASRLDADGALPDAAPYPDVSARLETFEFGAATVRLDWRVGGSANAAELFRLDPEGGWSLRAHAATDAQGTVSFTDSALFGGCEYRYGLRLDGCGRFGDTTVTIPDADSFVRAAAVPVAIEFEHCAPFLRWVISPGPIEAVRLYRREEAGAWSLAAELVPDSNRSVRFRDTESAPGKRYGYRLGLVSCEIERASGDTAVAIPARDSTLAPSVASVGFESAAVAIAWRILATSDSAAIEKRAGAGAWSSLGRVAIDTTELVRVTDPDVFAGCSYRYRIGLDDCRVGPRSAEVRVDVPDADPFRIVSASVVGATVASGIPVLRWKVSAGPEDRLWVERRTTTSEWSAITELMSSTSRDVACQDMNAPPGVRLGYRLAITTCGYTHASGEAWLELPPVAAPRFDLALHAPRPNPARQSVRVVFSLPDASPAWIEIHDALGRLIERWDVGSMGPGVHELTFSARRLLPPGLYWVRLQNGDHVRRAAVSLLE